MLDDLTRFSLIGMTAFVLLIDAGALILAFVKQKSYLPFRVIDRRFTIRQNSYMQLVSAGSLLYFGVSEIFKRWMFLIIHIQFGVFANGG